MTIDFPTDRPIDLPEHGSWPASKHRFDAGSVWAIKAALAARRPLLVRGNPGTGKSQLARAAAQQLGRCFVAEVVHSGTESQDLQCHFDAVGRLGEAQALAAACRIGEDEVQDRLNPQRYLAPGALWWVFDWEGAKEQAGMARCNHRMPAAPKGWTPDKGCVLLIDEIDKGNADLPNGLLETLGNGSFSVPHLKEPLCVGSRSRGVPPLVVVTTNEERELPDAFVRRCLVLHLFLPDEVRDIKIKEEDKKKALVDHLTVRGQDHFPHLEPQVLEEAALQLWTDRETARSLGVSPPGMAEYLDLLRAVFELGKDCAERLELLKTIGKFVLKKHPEML